MSDWFKFAVKGTTLKEGALSTTGGADGVVGGADGVAGGKDGVAGGADGVAGGIAPSVISAPHSGQDVLCPAN